MIKNINIRIDIVIIINKSREKNENPTLLFFYLFIYSFLLLKIQKVFTSMGYNKILLVVVNCWEILRFVSNSFFFLPHSLVILLLVVAVRELGTEKGKRERYL